MPLQIKINGQLAHVVHVLAMPVYPHRNIRYFFSSQLHRSQEKVDAVPGCYCAVINQTERMAFTGNSFPSAIGCHCSLEMLWICQVHYDNTFVCWDSSSDQCLLPKVSYSDDVVREPAGQEFLQTRSEEHTSELQSQS